METTLALSEYEIQRNKPMPSFNHGAIQANLSFAIKAAYNDKYRVISELNLDLSDWPSVPDISLYPKRPLDLENDITTMKEPPLCVIEIISPTQSISELTTKARSYFRNGVRSCWLVIPPLENVYVFSAPGAYEMFKAGETLRDEGLDIAIPVSSIFE